MESKKENFFREVNEAFVRNDVDYLTANVTEDIHWNMVGNGIINGKDEFVKMMNSMGTEGTGELKVANVITHGLMAVVDGEMIMTSSSGEEKTYAFCDVYQLDKFKNGKIKEMTSYVIEIKEEKADTDQTVS